MLREFEEKKTQGNTVEATVNSKEKNSQDFCLDFVQEFGLRMHSLLRLNCPQALISAE
jgi:hypothetical protein